jgi:hypothetical protein
MLKIERLERQMIFKVLGAIKPKGLKQDSQIWSKTVINIESDRDPICASIIY